MVALPPQVQERIRTSAAQMSAREHPEEHPLTTRAEDLPQLYQLALRYPPQFEGVVSVPDDLLLASPPDPIDRAVDKAREKFFSPPRATEEKKNLLSRLTSQKKLPPPSLEENTVSTDPAGLSTLVAEVITEEALSLSPEQTQQAERRLTAELTGLGVLEPLLDIEGITDIFVNSPVDVWIEAAGRLRRTAVAFEDDDAVRSLATRLITAAGARLDDACPSADVHTEKGYRVHAVLPPLSRGSTLLSIRIQPEHRLTLTDLAEKGLFGQEIGAILRYLVAQKKNFLISGGTGTGKTTLLNALLSICGSEERIITIEDSAELAPSHPHVLSLQSRGANSEGRGQVTLTELIRQALRMRPSRLVLGECRGAEVADMLTAMNTGHSGTGATLHANSTEAIPARLYALGALAGMSQEATALQASTAIEYLIHIERDRERRFIAEIAKLEYSNGNLMTVPLCFYQQARRKPVLTFSEAGQELLVSALQEQK